MKTKLLLCLLLFAINMNAQDWNEKTRDLAYEAPDSWLIKKWYAMKDGFCWEFLSGNKTTVSKAEPPFVVTIFGTWKRDKDKLTIQSTNVKIDIDANFLKDLSARQRDKYTEAAKQTEGEMRNQNIGKIYYNMILRLDEEFLIYAPYDPKTGLINDFEIEKYYNDYHKTKAEKAAKEKKAAEEKAKLEAEEKARKEAEEKARLEAEEKARLEAIEKEYWNKMGAEKKASADRAAAEGVYLVDLGLSVRWASANIGAGIGTCQYFAWGDTHLKKEFAKRTYNKPSKKYKDGMVLEPSDDIATQRWGTGWHIPTPAQWQELKEKCQIEEVKTKENGDWGLKVTGPNGNSIFLPFNVGRMGASKSTGSQLFGALSGAVLGVDMSSQDDGVGPRMKEGSARYWTNTLTSSKDEAICFGISAGSKFGRNKIEMVSDNIYYGLPVRAVME